MKYVIVKNDMGTEYPMLFPEGLNHSTVSKVGFGGEHEAVSAGFCIREQGRWATYGKSVTLRLASRPQDVDIVNQWFS